MAGSVSAGNVSFASCAIFLIANVRPLVSNRHCISGNRFFISNIIEKNPGWASVGSPPVTTRCLVWAGKYRTNSNKYSVFGIFDFFRTDSAYGHMIQLELHWLVVTIVWDAIEAENSFWILPFFKMRTTSPFCKVQFSFEIRYLETSNFWNRYKVVPFKKITFLFCERCISTSDCSRN